MFGWFRPRGLLSLAALIVAVALGGCVAYPAYPGYGYYGGGYYGGPYYGGGAVVAYGGGWGWRGRDGWRDRGWYR